METYFKYILESAVFCLASAKNIPRSIMHDTSIYESSNTYAGSENKQNKISKQEEEEEKKTNQGEKRKRRET